MPETHIDETEVPAPTIDLDKRPPVEVTDRQKEEFFKAFLADRPYEEEFSLLNGNYRIRLKSLTMKENNDLLTQISFDREKGRIEGVNDYYFSRVAHYRLGLALVNVGDQPFAPEITSASVPANKETGESYVSRRADVFSSWSMVKMAAVQASLQEFDQRVLVLVDAVSTPDFWKAAA